MTTQPTRAGHRPAGTTSPRPAGAASPRPAGAGGRLVVALAVAMTALAPLAACTTQGPDAAQTTTSAARRITEEESQRLGVLRFRNYDAGLRAVDVSLPKTSASEQLRLVGWVDFVEHRGYVSVTEGSPGLEVVTGELIWDGTNLAIAPPADGAVPFAPPGLPPAVEGWSVGALDPTTSQMTTILVLLLSLGADRPENSSLLLQSDAAWLGSATLAGATLDVFAGPSGAAPGGNSSASADAAAPDFASHVQYWLDTTGTAHRVVVPLGAGDTATIDLGPVDGATDVDLSTVGGLLPAADG